MIWTKQTVKGYFLAQDFSRGEMYYAQGRVTSFELKTEPRIFISARVRGSHDYYVSINLDDKKISGYCDCPRFAEVSGCKHIAAVLLKYCDETSAQPTEPQSDFTAQSILAQYLKLSAAPALAPEHLVHLEPILEADYGGYPTISFTVGYSKMYIVRNVENFAQTVYYGQDFSYGKGLAFRHTLDNFDETSRVLVDIILNQFPQFTTSEISMYTQPRYETFGYSKKELKLQGNSFERFFELYKDREVATSVRGQEKLRFCEGNPSYTLRLKPNPAGARLHIEENVPTMLFGDKLHLYANAEGKIMRCTDEFMRKVYPLVSGRHHDMTFSRKDLPTFCSCVLPEIENLVTIVDERNLLPEYTPDDCVACFYFDQQPGLGLTCELRYQYGDVKVSSQTPAQTAAGIKRNAKAEMAAKELAAKYLQPSNIGEIFQIQDEDAMIEFLSRDLNIFQQYGEVYVSEALRTKRISISSKPVVGVSVSDGMLTLDLDTGEFPPAELEDLYASLLKKRRYHKLRDGRYLPLNGSGYEKLAEVAHMAQLSEKQLAGGHVQMPAFRGLYLDQVLGSAEGVEVERNAEYRRMVRDFKAFADSDYQVPKELCASLRPYQKTGFQWLKTLEHNAFGGILADEMGLGKTVQMIAYLLTVPYRVAQMPSLIVCPASLVVNWAEELARFAPTLRVAALMGTASERKAQIESDEVQTADVWVTSYDLLKRDAELYAQQKFYCCVLDEAQNIKNQSTVVSRTVKQISCRQRFVLTGTPIENRLSELWNLFDFLMPGYLFAHATFVKKLEKPMVQSEDPAARRQLALLVQPFMLRRLKKDVLKELPEKIEHLRKVALSEEERRVYQAAAYQARKAVEESQEKLQILALLTKMRQICCDPTLCFENYDGPNSKLDACIELCAAMVENGHQILLFSQFTSMLDRIRERLALLKISNITLEGSTPKEKRAQLVKDFAAQKTSVFLISLKAGGTGLNLTSADVVIHYDPWWNLAAQNQATDRAHRIGQQSHVQVYKLIAKGTIEEKIVKLQEKKASLMDAVTGQTEGEPLSQEELLSLLDE